MFGWFKSTPFVDAQFGEFRRSRGAWRGTLTLEGVGSVPLVLSGDRAAPAADALCIARTIPSGYASWRPMIERELFEHYSPYAEAAAEEAASSTPSEFPRIDSAASVWPHTAIRYVQVSPLSGELTIEIGYRVAWDEEHTLGARLRDGRMLELCGSVLAP